MLNCSGIAAVASTRGFDKRAARRSVRRKFRMLHRRPAATNSTEFFAAAGAAKRRVLQRRYARIWVLRRRRLDTFLLRGSRILWVLFAAANCGIYVLRCCWLLCGEFAGEPLWSKKFCSIGCIYRCLQLDRCARIAF